MPRSFNRLYLCVRCGHERSLHDPNRVNDPKGWVDEIEEGYAMTILECMETPLPSAYLARIEDLENVGVDHFGSIAIGTGYQSPDPKKEDAQLELKRAPTHSGSPSFLLVPGGPLIPLD